MGELRLGVNNTSKNVKTLYVGVGGVSKKVKKLYVGVGGVAKLVWPSSKTIIAIPTVTSSPTVTGSTLYLTNYLSNYNSSYMTLSGTTSASSVGTYVAYANLKDTENTQWSDGTTGKLTIVWKILSSVTLRLMTINDTSQEPKITMIEVVRNGVTIQSTSGISYFSSVDVTASPGDKIVFTHPSSGTWTYLPKSGGSVGIGTGAYCSFTVPSGASGNGLLTIYSQMKVVHDIFNFYSGSDGWVSTYASSCYPTLGR